MNTVSLAPEQEKKATKRQLEKIKKEIEAKAVDVEKMLAYYGIERLEDLSREQASNAIELLNIKKPRTGDR